MQKDRHMTKQSISPLAIPRAEPPKGQRCAGYKLVAGGTHQRACDQAASMEVEGTWFCFSCGRKLLRERAAYAARRKRK